MQERATQFSHSETGKIVAEYEPRLGVILSQVAKEEARHYTFYRTVFEEILKRDPDQALHSASFILPAIDMPGVTMPGFKELADVIRRSGIYGPRDYLRIVQEQIRYWKIESLEGLGRAGAEGAGEDPRHPGPPQAHRRSHGDQEQGQDLQLRGRVQPRIRHGMSGRRIWLLALWAGVCGRQTVATGRNARPRAADARINLPPDQQDAHTLGREVFDLVDRAVAYRSSHRGRPAANLTQMGIESLTPTTVRRMVNVQREPVVTVAFRRPEQRQIVSCRGDSQDPGGGNHRTADASPSCAPPAPVPNVRWRWASSRAAE